MGAAHFHHKYCKQVRDSVVQYLSHGHRHATLASDPQTLEHKVYSKNYKLRVLREPVKKKQKWLNCFQNYNKPHSLQGKCKNNLTYNTFFRKPEIFFRISL